MERTGSWRGIAFDLDGTLLQSDHSIPSEMKAVCEELASLNIWVTIASARPPRSVSAIAAELSLPGPLVALNGAVVCDRSGLPLQATTMHDDIAATLIERYLNVPDVSLNVYTDREWLVPQGDARIEMEANAVGFEPSHFDPARRIRHVAKILLMTTLDRADAVMAEVVLLVPDFNVLRSASTYIEITSKAATKAGGLEAAAMMKGFTLKNMVVAGDGENDLPMLSASGFGIAMGHAPKSLHAVSSRVVGSNDDGSLARAVREIFLG